MCPGFIDMNHKVRIEHRQQPLEIPAAQGRQKCTDKFALFAHLAFETVLAPSTRRRARLASCFGRIS
jgi:hypothetical protein